MNELRIFTVAIIAVVVGFAGAWMVFGGRAAKLADENNVLRAQTGQLIQQLDNGQFEERRLVGRWGTTVERTGTGKVELIVDMHDDGTAVWESASGGQLHPIANGKWTLQTPDAIAFDLLIVNERSAEKGQRRTTPATIRESTPSCLVLDVEGTQWVFLRTS
jgi:hypothetical protein